MSEEIAWQNKTVVIKTVTRNTPVDNTTGTVYVDKTDMVGVFYLIKNHLNTETKKGFIPWSNINYILITNDRGEK